jgi:glutamate-1-semialdehyde 2,1-aminomutase
VAEGASPAAAKVQQLGVDAYRRRTPASARESVRAGTVGGPWRADEPHAPYPLVVDGGAGARLWDVDGNEYLDYHLGSGTLAAGHAHPAVVMAVAVEAARGAPPGIATRPALELAEELRRRYPVMEAIRFTPSAGEARALAIRLVRSATGRAAVVAVEGAALAPGDAVPFNDLEALAAALEREEDVAAVVVEPVSTAGGLLPPADGYLEGVRALARRHGAVVVFDETRTGCRTAPGGAPERYGVAPDVVVLGEIVGGGTALGAVGGPRELVEAAGAPDRSDGAPSPLGLAAGRACLTEVLSAEAHLEQERVADRLADGLRRIGETYSFPLSVTCVGALGGIFFADARPLNAHDAARAVGAPRSGELWLELLNRGVLLSAGPSSVTWSVSAAHGDGDVDRTLEAVEDALSEVFGI